MARMEVKDSNRILAPRSGTFGFKDFPTSTNPYLLTKCNRNFLFPFGMVLRKLFYMVLMVMMIMVVLKVLKVLSLHI